MKTFFLTLAFVVTANAQHLATSLSNNGTTVTYTLRNDDDTEVAMLKWDALTARALLPTGPARPTSTGAVFKRRGGPYQISDYLVIKPHSEASATFHIMEHFHFHASGEYHIQVPQSFRLISDQEVRSGHLVATAPFALVGMAAGEGDVVAFVVEPVNVQEVPITLATSIAAAELLTAAAGGNIPEPTYSNCDSDQQATVYKSVTEGVAEALAGYNYLDQNCTDDYVLWFGELDDDRYTKVFNDFVAIYNLLSSGKITVECQPDDCADDVFAYVYPDDLSTHTVHVCGAYWAAANELWSWDSKPGTFNHECSHFNDVGKTGDHAYGQTASSLSPASAGTARAF